MSCRVSWVRLRLRPGAQDPSTTMRELTPQGKNCWYPHSMVSFQERFTYDVTDLICIHWEQSPPDTLTREPTADVVLNLQLDFKEANGLN